ncbi:hypothetical protein AAFF_G00413210 [Aldrovandia affinis]|uniref:Neuropeptide Y receptor type 5 n=1 Tax=Aldrovandia affinis TaxID=143900 RepID=A0AAD7WJN3_9TELE|nr:hypothetical protein AAFF_G00413210 [Aldrovandia affinis]
MNGSESLPGNGTSSRYDPRLPLWEDINTNSANDIRYFLIGLYTTVSVAGLLGNILILAALARKWREKTIINFLVGSLAFSDILVVLFCSPFTLTCVLLDHWVFGEAMCHIVPFLQCVSVVVSTLVLMSIAMVRYHMISRPLSGHMSVSSGYILLAAIWTIGLSICSPLPVFHTTVDLSEAFHLDSLKNKSLCIEAWPSGGYRIAFTMCLLLVQYILPVACLTVSHATVCRRVQGAGAGALARPPVPAPGEGSEAIRLTLQQPGGRGGGFPPRRVSDAGGWSLGPGRKQQQRRRYSRKWCVVGPAACAGQGSGDPGDPRGVGGVPVCFELSEEEVAAAAEVRAALVASKAVSRTRRRSRGVFVKLTAVVLAFAVSWLPLHVFHLLTDFSTDLISSRHFKLIYCICHLLGMTSCCLNPILYGFLNNGIKSDLLSLIRCF